MSAACPHTQDAGAWVLRALDAPDAERFESHLASCSACRDEVADLQMVVDTLPIAAPQTAPPPELKDRLRADLTTAMKSRDELRTATLRMVLAAVSAEESPGRAHAAMCSAIFTPSGATSSTRGEATTTSMPRCCSSPKPTCRCPMPPTS